MQTADNLSDEDLSYWLAFAQLSGPGVGVSKVKALLETFGSVKAAWQAPLNELSEMRWLSNQIAERFVAARNAIDPEALLKNLHKAGANAIHFLHPHYPVGLKEIHDPPIVLFKKGGLPFEEIKYCAALIGTRNPTRYGQIHAKEYSRWLAERSVTVVSGMAIGIDSFAHWGAIEASGRTVAVLGSGVDICYPSSNRPLYNKLVESSNTAVVSEFFPGVKPQNWHFPARNRIISGMSEVLVIFEAGETSGSLITAKIAQDQVRPIFAMPGRIDSPASSGTNKLISNLTAELLTTPEQVITAMNWQQKPNFTPPPPPPIELYGREKDVFEFLSEEPVHFDYIVEKMGMMSGELSATLTMLELAGVVTRLPGDRYHRHEKITSI
jgi:DNA processing protein